MSDEKMYQFTINTPRGVYKSARMNEETADSFADNMKAAMKSGSHGVMYFTNDDKEAIVIPFEVLKQSVVTMREVE